MPKQQKEKPDRTVLVAIIGVIGVVAAALIAKIDFSPVPTSTPQTEFREEKKPQQKALEKAPETLIKSPDYRQGVSKPTDNASTLEVCFEDFDTGSQLKNYELKFEGYSIRAKTNNIGCVDIPAEIINHEKSISSYTIRATLFNKSILSEKVEIGLSESSTYKIKFKK